MILRCIYGNQRRNLRWLLHGNQWQMHLECWGAMWQSMENGKKKLDAGNCRPYGLGIKLRTQVSQKHVVRSCTRPYGSQNWDTSRRLFVLQKRNQTTLINQLSDTAYQQQGIANECREEWYLVPNPKVECNGKHVIDYKCTKKLIFLRAYEETG